MEKNFNGEFLMMKYIEDTRHLEKLKRNGFNPKLVVDVGTSNGEFFNECRKIFTDAEYLLFEARKVEETTIEETIKDIEPKPTLFYDTLLSDWETELKFYKMDAGSSVFEENTRFPKTVETKKTKRLDDILLTKFSPYSKDSLFPQPAFLKIDTQGSELDILSGMTQVRPVFEVIQLEVALLEYNKKAPTVAQVHAAMNSYGYQLYDFGPAFFRPDGAIFHMDWVFVAKRSKLVEKKLFWKAEEDYV